MATKSRSGNAVIPCGRGGGSENTAEALWTPMPSTSSVPASDTAWMGRRERPFFVLLLLSIRDTRYSSDKP